MMEMDNQHYITEIKVNKIRHLQDIHISLSDQERKHLILTGKNGSGKTTLLNGIRHFLKSVEDGKLSKFDGWDETIASWENNIQSLKHQQEQQPDQYQLLEQKIANIEKSVANISENMKGYFDVQTEFKNTTRIEDRFQRGEFILAFFDAKRSSMKMDIPNGINLLKFQDRYRSEESPGNSFIQYIVNLRAQQSFARDNDNGEESIAIEGWFTRFEQSLKEIFEDETLKLEFDYKNFNFNVIERGKEKYRLNQLSDGFSAVLNIITNLIMRMEHKTDAKHYDVEGIVLIDEVETHLHVGLQKKILPFLISFFPRIQFIVTTHSPFVLSSLENAIAYDLEEQIQIEDLTSYSYDGLIESYFNVDKYSMVIKEKINRYEDLVGRISQLESEEYAEMHILQQYLKDIPVAFSSELKYKFRDIELRRKAGKQ